MITDYFKFGRLLCEKTVSFMSSCIALMILPVNKLIRTLTFVVKYKVPYYLTINSILT